MISETFVGSHTARQHQSGTEEAGYGQMLKMPAEKAH